VECPRFQQTTILEQDASDTDNTDPFYLHAAVEKGVAGFVVQGATPTVVTSTTLGAATAGRNQAAGTNALLLAQFTAGAPAVGQLVQNITHSSFAWIYKANGGNWNMTQPVAPITVPFAGPTGVTEVNTWANTNTVDLLSLISINIVDFTVTVADYNAFFNTAGIVYHATIFDPSGVTNDSVRLSNVDMVESTTQRTIVNSGTGDFSVGVNLQLLNVFNAGGFNATSGSSWALAGAITSAAVASNGQHFASGKNIVDGDFINGGLMSVDVGYMDLGSVFLDANISTTANVEQIANPSGIVTEPATVLWGSGANTVNVAFSGHFAQRTGASFVSTFTAPGLVTGIQLNGTASAQSMCTGTINTGISTTPAHLDAACGAAGFNKAAYNWAGASVANF